MFGRTSAGGSRTPQGGRGEPAPRRPADGPPATPSQPTPPTSPRQGDPVTPLSAQRQQLRRMFTRPQPFGASPPGSPSGSRQRQSMPPLPGAIGQAKANSAWQALFAGDPPRVRTKTLGGGRTLFEFDADTPLEPLQLPIATVCQQWFSQPQTQADAIALLDAVCRHPRAPAPWWQALLGRHGEALSQARHLLPAEVFRWVKRLRQLALAEQQAPGGGSAPAALAWAQALAQAFPDDVQGAGAKALALVRQWAREAVPRLNLGPLRQDHTPPSTEREPRTTEREARSARGSLPPFSPPDTPQTPQTPQTPEARLRQALRTAESGGDPQPLIDALREWRQRLHRRPDANPADAPHGSAAPGDEEADEAFEQQLLEQVLRLCNRPSLPEPQRAALLAAAYAIVGSNLAFDALLRSDYASALHHWLPDQALQLLLAPATPPEDLPEGHPYRDHLDRVRRLVDWGLSEAEASQWMRDSRKAWALRQLFEGDDPCVHAEGSGADLRFRAAARPFDEVQADATLTVCDALREARQPQLALALMSATRDQALNERLGAATMRRWHSTLLALRHQARTLDSAPAVPLPPLLRKVFGPWLTVSLTIDPASAEITDLVCVIDTSQAARARRSVTQRALQKVLRWLEEELQAPEGLSWPLLVKLLETLEQALGPAGALPSSQWLHLALMNVGRSGDARPLAPLLTSLSLQQQRLRQQGHEQPLLDEALLDQVFAMARHPSLQAANRGNLIQNALPLLPPRNGPGAVSHATCLLAVLDEDDLLIQQALLDAYRQLHPFEPLQDPTPRLIALLTALASPERLRSESTGKAIERLGSPGRRTAWPLWRALCRALGQCLLPRLLEALSPTVPAHERQWLCEQILQALLRLSSHTNQAGLSAERQAELLADLSATLPPDQRRRFLEQLDAACQRRIEQAFAPQPGARPGPELARWLAQRGALLALIGRLDGGGPQPNALIDELLHLHGLQ